VQLVVKEANGFTEVLEKTITVLNEGNGNMFGEIKVIPNPYIASGIPVGNAQVKITWANTWQGSVRVKIYNVAAELIRSLDASPSDNQVIWNLQTPSGQTVSSGIYICVMEGKNDTGGYERRIVKIAVVLKGLNQMQNF
jgi:hypothetical protein